MDLLEAQALAFAKISESYSRVVIRFNWLPKRLRGEWRWFGRHHVLQKQTQGIRRTRSGGIETYRRWTDFKWWPR